MVLIFGKDNCPYTRKATEDYAGRDIDFQYIDVRASRDDMDRMLGYTKGVRRVPVIVDAGKVIIGFGGT